MIYCVDDDKTIREIEVYTLTQTGFAAKGFADGDAMFAALQTETPDLIVLDIMLPGKDGVEILKELRLSPATREIPVIMATAKGTEPDKIRTLDMGADDYLVKPFGMMEMVSRIKAVLRRCGNTVDGEMLTVGRITLNRREHTVFSCGNKVTLTNKEFELLGTFLQSPGTVFTRDRLLSELWGVDFVGETRTVDIHINTLRRKLGDAGKQIETVIGVGYRMESSV